MNPAIGLREFAISLFRSTDACTLLVSACINGLTSAPGRSASAQPEFTKLNADEIKTEIIGRRQTGREVDNSFTWTIDTTLDGTIHIKGVNQRGQPFTNEGKWRLDGDQYCTVYAMTSRSM
jgi:hypothetical protein